MWINIAIYTLLTILVIICLLMVTVILMQKSKQEGLGTAFGGGGMDSMFGAQTSSVLVKATVWFAVIYFVLTITLAALYAARTANRLAEVTDIVGEEPTTESAAQSEPIPDPAANADETPEAANTPAEAETSEPGQAEEPKSTVQPEAQDDTIEPSAETSESETAPDAVGKEPSASGEENTNTSAAEETPAKPAES